MFENKNNIKNPFAEKCENCTTDMWEYLQNKQSPLHFLFGLSHSIILLIISYLQSPIAKPRTTRNWTNNLPINLNIIIIIIKGKKAI